MESSKASSIGKLALIFLALFVICILLAFKASAEEYNAHGVALGNTQTDSTTYGANITIAKDGIMKRVIIPAGCTATNLSLFNGTTYYDSVVISSTIVILPNIPVHTGENWILFPNNNGAAYNINYSNAGATPTAGNGTFISSWVNVPRDTDGMPDYPFDAVGDRLANIEGIVFDDFIISQTDIDFTAVDDFNASSINSFSVNITWANGTQETYSTTNGTVSLINVSDSDTTLNVTYWNVTDYYDLTLYNQAITANTTNSIEASMYQAVATLQAFEKITNNSLSGVTFYIGSKSGTTFNLTAGTHTVIAEKAGYYNLSGSMTVPALSNASYNLEGMYNAIAQFYAYNALTNASVSSFTVYLDIGENLSTTNGTASTGIINNTNYTLNITGSGFTSRYNISFTVNETPEIVNISLYTFNSVRVNIYNESSMSPLLQSVTVHTISNLSTFSNVTSTGFILIDLLEPNTYELRFESSGFNPRSIFLTVTNDSTQNITVYMTENTTTELQVIEVLNTANQPLEGAVVWLQKEKLNQTPQWVTVQEAQTDYAGKTSVFVERDVTVFYRFAVIYGGVARPIEPSGNLFTGKTTFIPGITETIQLIVDLEEDPDDFISDALAIAVNCSLTNLTAYCVIVDGRNSITGAVMRIEAAYINETLNYESIANITFSGSSGTLEYNLTEINNSIWRLRTYLTYETSEALVWETIKSFDLDVIIEKNTGLFYAVIILIVVFALTVTLGPLASGLIGFAALIPLSFLKIVSIPIGVITGVLALVIIFFFRTRKLDE